MPHCSAVISFVRYICSEHANRAQNPLPTMQPTEKSSFLNAPSHIRASCMSLPPPIPEPFPNSSRKLQFVLRPVSGRESRMRTLRAFQRKLVLARLLLPTL